MYAGKEHGIPMFDTHPGLESLVVCWAKAQAKIHGETE
jgi:hypothetical protein